MTSAATSLFQFGPVKRWLLLKLLGQYQHALTDQGKISAADDILDVMDSVSGWCSPGYRLDD